MPVHIPTHTAVYGQLGSCRATDANDLAQRFGAHITQSRRRQHQMRNLVRTKQAFNTVLGTFALFTQALCSQSGQIHYSRGKQEGLAAAAMPA